VGERQATGALSLPENPDELLADHARVLDGAYREVASRLMDAAVTVDAQGKLHLGALEAVKEPASLVELRQLVGNAAARERAKFGMLRTLNAV
jgi:hypothetical protein